MSRRIDAIVIVGRDAALWLTALAIQHAFGRTGVRVRTVELPSLLRAPDVYAALPSLENLHRILGLDHERVMDGAAGVPTLGQRFANWSRSAPPFMHAYDYYGAPIEHVAFVQHWAKARREGLNVALEDFSLGAVAAKQGRMIIHNDATAAFSRAACGAHLDARAYADIIKRVALKAGVTTARGRVGQIERDGAMIKRLQLDDGAAIDGDLFVDASGPEAILLSQQPGAAFESWSAWLPCDRLIAASGKRLAPLPAFAQIAAHAAGWVGLYPLRNRTAVMCAYRSSYVSNEEMTRSLGVLAGLAIEGEAFVSTLSTGRQRAPWIGNCVGVGEAAFRLDPLDSGALQAIHTCISHLVALFPVDADTMPEAAPFNAGVTAHADNIRDFQIAHYQLNRRFDDPFWSAARETPPPETLAYKIQLFAARGDIALYDDETFQEESWQALLVGHGLTPRESNPLIDALAPAEQIQRFQGRLREIAAEVRNLPTMEQHLANRPGAGAP